MTPSSLSAEAISAALSQNWKEAVRINNEIVKEDEANIDALNRLSFAYMKLGHKIQAKHFIQKALAIDKYNQIALKNLKKVVTVKNIKDKSDCIHMSPLIFLEEPGKTKIVQCVNTAPSRILSELSCGQEVYLKVKKHSVEVRDKNDVYLGALPDDISFKLIRYIGSGNLYQTVIKSIGKNLLMILIRELSRGKKFHNQPSFTATTSYLPTGKSEILDLNGKPRVAPTGEDDEEETDGNESDDTHE